MKIPMMKFQFANKGENTGTINIYDDIGEGFFSDGVTAKNFASDLESLGEVDTLNVNINSVGGNSSDAAAIYNQLVKHPATVNVSIDGQALSAASVIAMAGDEITMAENALMMIHDPWTISLGSASDMRKTADTLDKVRDSIASTYVRRTGNDRDSVNKMMADETWMTAEEAVEQGFADSVAEGKSAATANNLAMEIYNVPKRFRKFFNTVRPQRGTDPDQEPNDMANDDISVAITPEQFAAQYPDAVKDWKNEGFKEGHDTGVEEERARAKSLSEQFKDRPQFAMQQFLEGNETAKAKAAFADILAKENEQLKADLQKKDAEGGGTDPVNLASRTDIQNTDDDVVTEESVKAEWDGSESIRNKYKQYFAYRQYRMTQKRKTA